jgi:hypothetical protein
MGTGLNGSDTSAEARRGRIRLLVLIGLLAAFQFHLNLPVLDHDWVYFDDDINIVLNPHLTGTLDSVKWAWTDAAYNRRYMPVGWMMFDGLFRAGGLNPALYHAASWLLSAANSVLLFLIVRRFLGARGNHRSSAWSDLASALAVFLLSVHPLRAELVGWASGLLYLGSTFLASLAVLAGFPLRPEAARPATEWLGRGLFLFSLLLYPVHVGLPLLLIVAACSASPAVDRATLRAAVLRYSAWLLLVLLVGGWNLIAAASTRWFAGLNGATDHTMVARLPHALAMLGHYAAQTVWPALTSPFYGDLAGIPFTRKWLVPLAVLGAFVIFIAWPRTRYAASWSLAALLVALLPFVGLLDQGQAANDRYTFLLLAVLAVILGRLLADIPRPSARVAASLAVVVVALLLVPAYRGALGIWRTTATLQARVDLAMAERPDVRLGFARPAMNDFMSGNYAGSQRRLKLGFLHFGAHPELIGAAGFIEETRTSLTGSGRDPSMPPYAFMHLDLAKKHRDAGYVYAAKVHADYARHLMSAALEAK